MKKFDVKAVVATAIGAAIFFVLARFVAIPTWVPNTNLNLQYGFLALFAAVFGPLPAALAALIGHWLADITSFGAWYSWIISSGLVGLLSGFIMSGNRVEKGEFGRSDQIKFAVATILSNGLVWFLVAPVLDILIHQEAPDKVFLQGATAGVFNMVTALVVGYLLLSAYSKTRTKSGSLSAK